MQFFGFFVLKQRAIFKAHFGCFCHFSSLCEFSHGHSVNDPPQLKGSPYHWTQVFFLSLCATLWRDTCAHNITGREKRNTFDKTWSAWPAKYNQFSISSPCPQYNETKPGPQTQFAYAILLHSSGRRLTSGLWIPYWYINGSREIQSDFLSGK